MFGGARAAKDCTGSTFASAVALVSDCSPRGSALHNHVPFQQPVATADVIDIATVEDTGSRWGANKNMIFTDVVFSDIEAIKRRPGDPLARKNKLTLSFAGGEMEREWVYF